MSTGLNGECSCAANYKRSYNKCVLCLNYLTPAQVTAYFDSTFLKVVIEFTSAVVSSAAQTCDLLLLPSSIQKLGNGYACAWASNELSVSVLLGMNSTLINEKLELNYVTSTELGTHWQILSAENSARSAHALHPTKVVKLLHS